jgi:hypothetical protein
MTDEAPSRTRIGKPDWAQLIPRLEGYLIPGPTSPEAYAFLESTLEVAIGFSEIFWPPFIEYDDMVFRGSSETPICGEAVANIESWLTRFDGNRSEVERMINHEHLIDLFWERSRSGGNDQIAYLGRVVREMWAAKLKFDFPNRKFVVDLEIDVPDENGVNAVGDWIVTFYQSS